MTIAQLNAAGPQAFTDAVGFAFEQSPWVAREAFERRPFRDVDHLHAAMVSVVREAPLERQIALIAAHPELAGHMAREGRLTPSSQNEQSSAGLGTLGAALAAQFEERNRAYRERFGFPFVICAREHTAAGILVELQRRSANDRAAEIETALAEIAKIARLRLQDVSGTS